MSTKDFPINQLIEFKLTSDKQPISHIIVDKVINLIFENFIEIEGPFKTFPLKAFHSEIEWIWLAKRGTLPKRIDSWYAKNLGKHLSEDILSKIGNIVRSDVPKDKIYYFDIDNKFDWSAGTFGDHMSCFFEYSEVGYGRDEPGDEMRDMASSPNMTAVRFFKPFPKNLSFAAKNKYYGDSTRTFLGTSRAWMYSSNISDDKASTSNTYTIFNGYGQNTKDIASVISSYLELPVKKVEVTSDNISINDNATGYVIGEAKEIESLTTQQIHVPHSWAYDLAA